MVFWDCLWMIGLLQSGAAGWVKGFVYIILRVPLAQLPVELSENIEQNLLLNQPPHTVYSSWSYWIRQSQSDKTVFALGRSPDMNYESAQWENGTLYSVNLWQFRLAQWIMISAQRASWSSRRRSRWRRTLGSTPTPSSTNEWWVSMKTIADRKPHVRKFLGFLYSWFIGQRVTKISCTKTQTNPNWDFLSDLDIRHRSYGLRQSQSQYQKIMPFHNVAILGPVVKNSPFWSMVRLCEKGPFHVSENGLFSQNGLFLGPFQNGLSFTTGPWLLLHV